MGRTVLTTIAASHAWRAGAWGLLGLLWLASARAQVPALAPMQVPDAVERVQFEVPAGDSGSKVTLQAWWYRPPAALAPATGKDGAKPLLPAVLLLHGCGGMLNRRGQPAERMREYAALLNEQGWHALAVDSLTPRGEKELCTQRIGTRKINQNDRRRDALAALQWLAAQPGVDGQRLALLGWSHGGSAVLAASNLRHADVAAAKVLPRLSVAFYPGCGSDLRGGYRPATDTLMLVGKADDWTPAAPCQALAARRGDTPGSREVRVVAYEGAYHGFDGTVPLRLRTDVPNGVYPGQGVHVGGHPVAREQSRKELLAALNKAFGR
ncbi:MAG: dienelactone hydrolase family protein [Acidovorax sp.]